MRTKDKNGKTGIATLSLENQANLVSKVKIDYDFTVRQLSK